MQYVYFLEAPEVNRIKIGCAGDPESRAAQISTACPVDVSLLGYIEGDFAREAELHQIFAHLRKRGEWFEGSDELRHEIALAVLVEAWNAAGPDARQEFLLRIDVPVFDRSAA
jgi:hypothetical protein